MILSVNQPYFFPYLPFYQMVYHSDIFISADCVNFCKKKFINRNVITDNSGKIIPFNLPLQDMSSFKLISDTFIHNKEKTKNDLIKKLKIVYGQKNNSHIFDLIDQCFTSDKISHISTNSIKLIFNYLDIDKKIELCSEKYNLENNLKKEFRIYNLCEQTKCTQYVNLIGGKKIYDKDEFLKRGIELFFIKSDTTHKTSILDLLFRYSKEDLKKIITEYSLI